MKHIAKNERGASKVVIIAIIAIVAVLAVGGWWFFLKDKNKSETQKAANEAAKQIEASCTDPDKNICKFYAAMAKATTNMTLVSAGSTANGASTMTMKFDDGKYSLSTNDGTYDTIVIGNDTYSKGGGTWWKQTTTPDANKAFTDFKFEDEATKPAAERTTYKLIGEEACGDLTCYKYQIIEPASAGGGNVGTQFMWIDKKDFLVRKQTTSSEGQTGTTEIIFTYGDTKVEVPSPVKDVPAGQVLYPGASEPVANPSTNLGQ